VIVFIVFIVLVDRVILNRLQTRAFRWRDQKEVDFIQVEEEQVGL
jgi:hypothetical protein